MPETKSERAMFDEEECESPHSPSSLLHQTQIYISTMLIIVLRHV